MPELKLANAAITDMQMRRAWCILLRSMQNAYEELADAKAENDALRDDVAAGRRRLHQSSLSVNAWSHHASGVDIGYWRRAERDYFTLQRVITMQKQLEGTQVY